MKDNTKRLIESFRARASLIASVTHELSEPLARKFVAKLERRTEHSYRRKANIGSLWSRVNDCKRYGVDSLRGKTRWKNGQE